MIRALAPDGPLVLVAPSMGGMAVMALAEQIPALFAERVAGVALIATSPGRSHQRAVGPLLSRRQNLTRSVGFVPGCSRRWWGRAPGRRRVIGAITRSFDVRRRQRRALAGRPGGHHDQRQRGGRAPPTRGHGGQPRPARRAAGADATARCWWGAGDADRVIPFAPTPSGSRPSCRTPPWCVPGGRHRRCSNSPTPWSGPGGSGCRRASPDHQHPSPAAGGHAARRCRWTPSWSSPRPPTPSARRTPGRGLWRRRPGGLSGHWVWQDRARARASPRPGVAVPSLPDFRHPVASTARSRAGRGFRWCTLDAYRSAAPAAGRRRRAGRPRLGHRPDGAGAGREWGEGVAERLSARTCWSGSTGARTTSGVPPCTGWRRTDRRRDDPPPARGHASPPRCGVDRRHPVPPPLVEVEQVLVLQPPRLPGPAATAAAVRPASAAGRGASSPNRSLCRTSSVSSSVVSR